MPHVRLKSRPIQATYDAVYRCLFHAYDLDKDVRETLNDLEYEKVDLTRDVRAEKTIPELNKELKRARCLLEAVANQLAAAFDSPATVGKFDYESFHEGVLTKVEVLIGTIHYGLSETSSELPFKVRWRLFCKWLEEEERQLLDVRRDTLVAMLKKEAIRADELAPYFDGSKSANRHGIGSRANYSVKFSGRRPTPRVEKLAYLLRDNKNSNCPRQLEEIAREAFGEQGHSVLQQVRKLQRCGRIAFPGTTKRSREP